MNFLYGKNFDGKISMEKFSTGKISTEKFSPDIFFARYFFCTEIFCTEFFLQFAADFLTACFLHTARTAEQNVVNRFHKISNVGGKRLFELLI